MRHQCIHVHGKAVDTEIVMQICDMISNSMAYQRMLQRSGHVIMVIASIGAIAAGQKPLVLRYQSGTAMQPIGSAAAEAQDTSTAALPLRRPPQGEPSDCPAKPGAAGAGVPRPAR